EIDAVPHRPRLPRAIRRPRRRRIPRTHFLADVAAVYVRADGGTHCLGDVAAQLDREIRDAAIRVEDARRDDRTGRTRLEAQRARAAAIERREVDLERQTANDHAEENPRSDLGIDDAGVLPDPPDAGVLRIDALLHRSCVDVGASLGRFCRLLLISREMRAEMADDDTVNVVA